MRALVILFLSTIFIISCKNSPAGTSNHPKMITIDDGYSKSSSAGYTGSATVVEGNEQTIPLEDYIRRVPGVIVRGQGPTAMVRIRGISHSIMGDSEPLFLINGMPVSGGFSGIYGTIATGNIASVNVLKDAAGASLYGSRGANGVINIKLK
jgi:TonB-dependent SusC/RagA subfamily outer membrane receptor